MRLKLGEMVVPTIQFIAKKVEALLIKFCEVTVVVNDKFQEIYKKWYNVEAIRIFNTPFYNKLDANNYLREKFSINNKPQYLHMLAF